jgi:sugar phosphate isomerase/epimerase
MSLELPGADTSLSLTVGPLLPLRGGTLEGVLSAARAWGVPSVQLDATRSGLRPRELGQRDRRDLMGTLQRQDTRLSGIDLFLPRRHFQQTQHVDRATSAALQAIELAADLGRVPLSLPLPIGLVSQDVLGTLIEAVEGRGVPLAVHAEDRLDDLLSWADSVDLATVGIGLDPGAVIARGMDPAKQTHRLGHRLISARLSDFLPQEDPKDHQPGRLLEGDRVALGKGDLDELGYRVALGLTSRRVGPVVLDVRQLSDPAAAAQEAIRRWRAAAP